ncbi:MAG TPA: tryptophanase [Candidatus Polarisedimenticolaceae bacterium]|nr:tryptophanase [Candidatus Polarisedimenticolaceae bacterium]
MKTIFEPFRVKSVERLRPTTRDERREILARADYNLFRVSADDIMIDLLTDSGTGAMSAEQWAGMMRGDESYAGARSWFRFRDRVRELTGFRHIVPTHQGRAAERILFSCLDVAGKTVVSNTHFDTTRANVEYLGGRAVDIPIAAALRPSEFHPFKGDIDLDALVGLLDGPDEIACVVHTVTNNSGGGQPASMGNLRAASRACRQRRVPFFLDACRFAENAYFIKLREAGFEHREVESIAREMFSLADGATFSAKKDGLANIGGFLASNDDRLARQEVELLILTEGFPTYGGLAGRDLEAIAIGLGEVVDEEYLRYRIASTRYLGDGLTELGYPIIQPPGGHAIYIDAGSFLPRIPRDRFPGQALACAFYVEGGVRSVEIGSLMFGGEDPKTHQHRHAALELLRLAIPRRVYTQSHMDYVLEVGAEIVERRSELAGYRIVEESPQLRHFTARLAPI